MAHVAQTLTQEPIHKPSSISCFKPILLSAHKLILLIYGDNNILATSRLAVLVNGCPGPWITCRRGLRQGDALSPYLFLLVADVLQCLIKDRGTVRHPLVDGPCPVLQYADDTLIIARASTEDIIQLRSILDSFSAATGLKINYNKSTVVPMHVPEAKVRRLLKVLQCQPAEFPQVYLGLPLSNTKLNLAAFTP